MNLVRLTPDYVLTAFDCGDSDLNEFLMEDAKLTVDAYLSAIPFYEKNGFIQLTQKEEDDHTRLMYFDMMEMV